MKILAFTDTHLSSGAERALLTAMKKHKPDLLLCCGDFTIFMREALSFLQTISKTKIKTLLIHGNHEDEDSITMLCEGFPSIHFIHGKAHLHEHVLFVGYGGGGFAVHDSHFLMYANTFSKQIKNHKGPTIMVLHQPPHDSGIDSVYGSLAGCKTTKKFIDQHAITYVFAGHLHEHSGKKKKIGKTTFINPGPTGIIIDI